MKQVNINRPNFLYPICRFYVNGFRSMKLGKTLWKLIIIKLIIIFGVLKLFFFPNYLSSKFTSDQQKSDYVLKQLSLGNTHK